MTSKGPAVSPIEAGGVPRKKKRPVTEGTARRNPKERSEMTPQRKVPSWHTYFLEMAKLAATRSKHPRSQHGAVLVDGDHRIVATGYNGAPSGFPDSEVDWTPGMTGTARDWTIHAEENALLYAGFVAAKGCDLYVTGLPCPRCLLRAAQCGVVRLICGDATYSNAEDDAEILRKLIRLTGIDVYGLDGDGRLIVSKLA
jgi:dCMP deaminase